MITKPILVSLVTSLLLSSGCAAKNRWLSRKDYSEMQDPFMQPDAVASTGKGAADSKDSVGRVRMDGLTADAGNSAKPPGAVTLPGPKPIPRAGARSDANAESTARSGRIASASYPKENDSAGNGSQKTESAAGDSPIRSYQGSALSEFLSRRKADASPTAAVSPSSAGAPSNSMVPSTTPTLSARTAPTPKLTEEAESFSSFLRQNPNPLNTAPKQPTQAVHESSDPAANFTAWAEQKNSEWSRGGDQAAANLQTGVSNQLNAAAGQVQTMADTASPDFGTPDFDGIETAEPLIRQSDNLKSRPVVQSGFQPVFEEPQPSAPAREPNPFENPFDFEEHQPVVANSEKPTTAKPAPQAKANRRSLDDSFQMDNGWKPAHMTRP